MRMRKPETNNEQALHHKSTEEKENEVKNHARGQEKDKI